MSMSLPLEWIEYLGSVGPARCNRLLEGARALLHPILFDEPFGLSVVEAMVCGTPVIAFNRGSMPELIRHGTTGFLVGDVGQAIDVAGKLDRTSLQGCRRHVENHFSVDRMVDDYFGLYV